MLPVTKVLKFGGKPNDYLSTIRESSTLKNNRKEESFMSTRQCRKCGQTKLLTTQFFNQLSTGNWRWVCKSCMAENSRKHHTKNPEMAAARRERYKARLVAADGAYLPADITRIRKELKDNCYYCDTSLRGAGEVDHKTPLSRGGTNYPENVTLACRECNKDKRDKTAEEFIEWRRKLGRPVAQRPTTSLDPRLVRPRTPR